MSRLFVRNVPPYVDERRLREHFSQRGHVTDVRIMKTKSGRSRQFAFVGYKTEAEAQKALNFFNRTFLDTRRLNVEIAKPYGEDLKDSWSRHTKRKEKAKEKEKSASKDVYQLEEIVEDIRSGEVPETTNDEKVGELEDFLSTMQARKRKKVWENDINIEPPRKKKKFESSELLGLEEDLLSGDESDELYEDIPVVNRRKQKEQEESDVEEGEIEKEEVEGQDEEKDPEGEKNGGREKENSCEKHTPVKSDRLFVRNLSYACTEEDLLSFFSSFAPVKSVHIPIDKETKKSKGFGYVSFFDTDTAEKVLKEADGNIHMGRLIHVMFAKDSPDDKTEPRLSKLSNSSYKKGKEKKLRTEDRTEGTTNSLFMRPETVAGSIAEKLGVGKSEFLNPDSTDLAVRVAVGETQLIQEAKEELERMGISVDKLESIHAGKEVASKKQRSKTCLLVKNLPAVTAANELRSMFAANGSLSKFVLLPSRTLCIVEFYEPSEARKAFRRLAYTSYRDVPLYLEWAPIGLMKKDSEAKKVVEIPLSEESVEEISPELPTVYIKNINFDSNERDIAELFGQIGKVRKVTLPYNKSSGHHRGYGFVEYEKPEDALKSLKSLQGIELDNHKLELKIAGSQGDIKENKKKGSTKLIVKNVPFEASKKELRKLLSSFGEVKAIRMPKKFDNTHRGFVFVEYVTPQEAANALEAFSHTHFYGRHLVVQYSDA